ncbi:exonuclease SBCC, partial [Reticulomyxa filosa]
RKSGQQEIVTRICRHGGSRIKLVVQCFQKNIQIKKMENPKEIAKFVTMFMENIVTAADLFCKNYAAMQTNFELAQAVIKWKPYSSGTNPFWEAITFGCQTIVSQLIDAIKVLGKFEEMLGIIRSGLLDFRNRVQLKETIYTFNKSNELLKICQQYAIDAQKTELFIAVAFQKVSKSKEVENAFKNIKKIMQDMKETKKEKMKLQLEKNKIDEKMGGLAKNFGDVQEKLIACEFEIFIAQRIEDISKEWSEQKNNEYQQQMQNFVSWCNSDKLDTVQDISIQFMEDCKNIVSERIKKEKENAEKNKREINHFNLKLEEEKAKKNNLIGSASQRIQELEQKIDKLENKLKDIFKSIDITENIDPSIFEQFFKCCEKLEDGLNLNKKCLQNVESSTRAISQWFEKNNSRSGSIEVLLEKNGLQILTPFLSKLGVSSIAHLKFRDKKAFEDKFSKPLIQNGADKKDIKKLEDFCQKLTPCLPNLNKSIESGSKEEGLVIDVANHLENFLKKTSTNTKSKKCAVAYIANIDKNTSDWYCPRNNIHCINVRKNLKSLKKKIYNSRKELINTSLIVRSAVCTRNCNTKRNKEMNEKQKQKTSDFVVKEFSTLVVPQFTWNFT